MQLHVTGINCNDTDDGDNDIVIVMMIMALYHDLLAKVPILNILKGNTWLKTLGRDGPHPLARICLEHMTSLFA